jgi:hypothetical protein
VSGYLGRVATQLAGGGVAPKPTLRTSSPIVSHDQLPMVDGLEAAPPPALTDAQNFDAPAPDSMPRPAVDNDTIASEQDRRAEAQPQAAFHIEVDRQPARARDDGRGGRRLAADTEPPSVAAPVASRASVRSHAAPSVDTPASHRPASAFDLVHVLGRVSQDIAEANRAVVQPDPPSAREPEPRRPETARTSTSQLTPAPTRENTVAVSTVTTPEAPAAPKVQIGELRIEVVEEAPRHVTRRTTRQAQTAPLPGRGPIGARPSKRRFAAGRG